MNLRISEQHHKLVRQATSPSFRKDVELPPETGCILLITDNEHPENPCLLVAEVLLPGSGDLAESRMDGLVFSASFLRRALLRVRERHLAGFLTVHTHPLADERVAFSLYDDAQDPKLMCNLHELQPAGVFGSVVLGRKSVAGRIWPVGEHQAIFLDRLMIVGETLEMMSLHGEPLAAVTSSEVFDRALALTGAGALSRLSQMRIGVVGAGGTGSLVVELLARAGVGEIVLFDFDVAETSNLNRVLHLREKDVLVSCSKADRLLQVIAESGLPTRLTAITGGNITDPGVARNLTGCDLIVGCVDCDWPRLVLCEVAYQFLIPLIDIGTEIGLSDTQVQSVDTRVSLVGPGRPCMICSGVVSRDRVRLEGYSDIEQDRVLKLGYSADIRLKAPAVMDLNMRAASMAVLVIRHFLQPYLLTPLPHTIKEAVTNFSTRTLQHTSCANCTICGTVERIGIGNGARLTTRTAGGIPTASGPPSAKRRRKTPYA
jgi:hypothetical protein